MVYVNGHPEHDALPDDPDAISPSDRACEELHRIADEDARLLAEGKPLPSGAGDEGLIRLPVSAG